MTIEDGMFGLFLLCLASCSVAGPISGSVWYPLPAGFNQSKPDAILGLVDHAPLAFDGMYVFGDSACDTGNLFEYSGNTDPDPKAYWRGRFSNGPMWPDYLQARHQLKARNYAFGGAVVNQKNNIVLEVPDFYEQLKAHKSLPSLGAKKPLALIQFVGNDLINQTVTPASVSNDFKAVMQQLIDLGEIKHFLIILTSIIDYASLGFNRALASTADALNAANKGNVTVQTLSVIGLYKRMIAVPPATANPKVWSRTDEYCYDMYTGKKCADPENHLYFDNYHPSTVPNHNSALFVSEAINRIWPH
ncbi:hypothetical protein DSO57_1032819 [Entomophthora muscae]|uniref:Uncharacterized protein n=1 Tax=Entomophthora muscae TaxID=34485 RepID=A0ACC2SPB2_9FUNG|nr:hypothetical protein DSO57_1032819 [Entomophthora muscae]